MGHRAEGIMVRVSVIACQGGDSHGGGGGGVRLFMQ